MLVSAGPDELKQRWHRYAYMIDNVILLITGTLHERNTQELLERCHPLGVFETLPALCVATNVEELYRTALVETPLGLSSQFSPASAFLLTPISPVFP